MTMWKHTRVVSFIVPEELLAMIDFAAHKKFVSRSDYMRQVLLKDVIDSGVEPNREHYEKPGDTKTTWLDLDDS